MLGEEVEGGCQVAFVRWWGVEVQREESVVNRGLRGGAFLCALLAVGSGRGPEANEALSLVGW